MLRHDARRAARDRVPGADGVRSEEHTSELQSQSNLVCRLLLAKKSPKGAMGTHLGIINSAITYERCYGLGDAERTLVAVPLIHVTGLIAQVVTLSHLRATVDAT